MGRRKSKKRPSFLRHRTRLEKDLDIQIGTDVVDVYRASFPSKDVMDLLVELYTHIVDAVNTFKIKNKKQISDVDTVKRRVKIKNCKKDFIIYIGRLSGRKIYINLYIEQTNLIVNLKKVEQEITESFLRGEI